MIFDIYIYIAIFEFQFNSLTAAITHRSPSERARSEVPRALLVELIKPWRTYYTTY